MRHKYKGCRYELAASERHVRFKIFDTGIKNTLRWICSGKAKGKVSSWIERKDDECDENFIVRVHQAAHEFIDEIAEKHERRASLVKICNDTGVEFLSRIAK